MKTFLTELMNKYTIMYDVYRDEKLDDIEMPFIAIYKRRDERYMITKKIKVYGVENQQVVFGVVPEEPLTVNFLKRFQEIINRHAEKYIPAHQEHMSTILVGLIITDQKLDPTILKEVRRFRKIKFLKYGFHGWSETYIAIINPHEKSLQVHPKGKAFVSSIEKMLREENFSK